MVRLEWISGRVVPTAQFLTESNPGIGVPHLGPGAQRDSLAEVSTATEGPGVTPEVASVEQVEQRDDGS